MLNGMERQSRSNAVRLLLLATALMTLLIQSGELGSADTTRRLQVTHSLWTAAPQVVAGDYPEFGIPGRHGRLYAWYGIGQSLLMLPADVVGTAAEHAPWWRAYAQSGATPQIRAIVVSASTNVLVNVLTALVAFAFLEWMGFSCGQAVAGTLALLCGTTHLHYAQNLMENNYIFLLTLTGMALQLRWLRTGERRWLWWGAAALGLNLLTRLTTAVDILAAACFVGLVWWFSRSEDGMAGRGAWEYLRTVLPVYAAFFFLDRVYQFVRFGSWTNTYVSLLAREQRRWDPSLPATFPFSGHFFEGGIHSGLLGPLFSPEKSILVFDPLLPLAVVLTAVLWRRLSAAVRAFAVATWLLLLGYLVLYGRYFSWAGDAAWGDRYVSTAVEMVALLAVPLLLRYRRELGRVVWGAGLAVLVASVAIQLASVAFWLPLEIYQIEDIGRDTSVVLLRFKNIAALATGRRMPVGIDLPGAVEDAWDAMHVRTWNFMPSLMRHVGVAPLWVVHVLYAVWIAMAIALVWTLVRLWRVVRETAS